MLWHLRRKAVKTPKKRAMPCTVQQTLIIIFCQTNPNSRHKNHLGQHKTNRNSLMLKDHFGHFAKNPVKLQRESWAQYHILHHVSVMSNT